MAAFRLTMSCPGAQGLADESLFVEQPYRILLAGGVPLVLEVTEWRGAFADPRLQFVDKVVAHLENNSHILPILGRSSLLLLARLKVAFLRHPSSRI